MPTDDLGDGTMHESNQSGGAIPHCPNVLLSIKPEHADAILSGDKRIEYRRVAPARGPVLRLVLYASSPEQAAIGTAWCHKVRQGEPETLVEDTVNRTPHSKEEVLDYFDGADTGYALSIDAYYRFDEPVPLENLEAAGHKPSQNFRYLGTVPKNAETVNPQVVVPGMETPDTDQELATDGGQDEGSTEGWWSDKTPSLKERIGALARVFLSGRFEHDLHSAVAARPRTRPMGEYDTVGIDLYKVWFVLHYDEHGDDRTTNLYIRKIGDSHSNIDQIHESGIQAGLLPLRNDEWQYQQLAADREVTVDV